MSEMIKNLYKVKYYIYYIGIYFICFPTFKILSFHKKFQVNEKNYRNINYFH